MPSHPTSAEAEQIQRRRDRARATPVVLLGLERELTTFDFFFDGLKQEYLHSVASERIVTWVAAAHAVIDLLATGPSARSAA